MNFFFLAYEQNKYGPGIFLSYKKKRDKIVANMVDCKVDKGMKGAKRGNTTHLLG